VATILATDDSDDNLALISTLLEKGGFDVQQAHGGEECIELA
jgi:CheY-like chemotaxis protein